MLEGLCEGLVVAKKAGVDPEKLLEVVMASGFSSPYFPFKATAIAKRDFDQHFSIDLLVKDQTPDARGGGLAEGPDAGPGRAARGLPGRARQGWGQEDIAAVYKVIEKNAGL